MIFYLVFNPLLQILSETLALAWSSSHQFNHSRQIPRSSWAEPGARAFPWGQSLPANSPLFLGGTRGQGAPGVNTNSFTKIRE